MTLSEMLQPVWDGTGMPPEFWGPAVPTVITNLVPNPSFETAGVVQVARENLVTDPAPLAVGGWTLNLGAVGVAAQTVEAVPGFDSATALVATVTTATAEAVEFLSPIVPLDQNMVMQAQVSLSVAASVTAAFQYSDAAGTPVGGGVNSEILDLAADEVGTYTNYVTTQVDPERTHVRVQFRVTTFPLDVGAQVRVGAVLIETTGSDVFSTANPLPYFDGDTADTAEETFAWSGAAGASSSTLSVTPAKGVQVTPAAGGHIAYQSAAWALSGGKSLLVKPYSGVSERGAPVLTLEAGKTYTVLATAHHNGGLAAIPGPYDRRINGGEAGPMGPAFPSAPGDYPLRFTFEARPAGQASLGGDTKGIVWWDNVLVVEGQYDGDYFDGDTPATPEFTYAWTGEPHNSPSTATPTTT